MGIHIFLNGIWFAELGPRGAFMGAYTDAQMLWVFYLSLIFYLIPGIAALVHLWMHRDRVITLRHGENVHVLRLPESVDDSGDQAA